MMFLRLRKMPKHADGEEDGGDGEIIGQDRSPCHAPCPGLTSTIVMATAMRARVLRR